MGHRGSASGGGKKTRHIRTAHRNSSSGRARRISEGEYMATEIKRRPSETGRVVIHNRRFWRVSREGKWERIYLSERAKGHLWQAKATVSREQG